MTSKRRLQNQTKTLTMKPAEIPKHYVTQIADLLHRYLNFALPPASLIPYFSRAYNRFYLTTSADGQRVLGCAGINTLTVDDVQLIYLGAVVMEQGSRGTATLYRPIFRDVLQQRICRPHQQSYLFGALVNPYAYATMARRFDPFYPSPARPTLTPEMLDLAVIGLTQLYGTGLEFDHARGLVRPPVAMASVAEKPLDSANAALNFYTTRNPDYRSGVGLIFSVPLMMKTMVGVGRHLHMTLS